MQIIFSTGSLYTYGTDRCFQIAARCGFDGIEVMADARWDTRQAPALNGLIQRHGIPVVAIHSPFFNVPGWPPDQPALISRSIELATAVGAKVVVHHLPWRRGFAYAFLNHRGYLLPIPMWERERAYRRWLVGITRAFRLRRRWRCASRTCRPGDSSAAGGTSTTGTVGCR